jgi:hypothetical protein
MLRTHDPSGRVQKCSGCGSPLLFRPFLLLFTGGLAEGVDEQVTLCVGRPGGPRKPLHHEAGFVAGLLEAP